MRIAHSGSGCILVIDDEELIRETVTLMLNEMGYAVLTAEDGMEGVALFTKKCDTIDLVIVDMIMPRMDGLETYRKIRAVSRTVPVISASGFHPDISASTLKEEGIAYILDKPFRRETLVEALKTAFGYMRRMSVKEVTPRGWCGRAYRSQSGYSFGTC